MVTLLTRAAEDAPDHVALAVQRDGEWVKWTYEKYLGKSNKSISVPKNCPQDLSDSNN